MPLPPPAPRTVGQPGVHPRRKFLLPLLVACTLVVVEQHSNHRWLRPDPRASRVALAACVKDMDQAGTLPPTTTKSRLR